MCTAISALAQQHVQYSIFTGLGHAFTLSEQKNNRSEFNLVSTIGFGCERNIASTPFSIGSGLRLSRVELNNFKTILYIGKNIVNREYSESFRTLYLEVPFGVSYTFAGQNNVSMYLINELMLGTSFTGNYGVLNFFQGEGGAGLDFHNYSIELRYNTPLYKPLGLLFGLSGKMNLQSQTAHDLSTIQAYKLLSIQVGISKVF
jgi:hypothetical protein